MIWIYCFEIYLHSCPRFLTTACYSRLGMKPVSDVSRVNHAEHKPKYFLQPHMSILAMCKTVSVSLEVTLILLGTASLLTISTTPNQRPAQLADAATSESAAAASSGAGAFLAFFFFLGFGASAAGASAVASGAAATTSCSCTFLAFFFFGLGASAGAGSAEASGAAATTSCSCTFLAFFFFSCTFLA